MSIEAMKLALFALDIVKIHYTQNRHINEAIAALKERLADPMREVQRLGQEIEQEPVAHWSDCAVHSEPAYPKSECDCGGIVAVADYTALSDKYVALSDKYVALKAQHKEQEPVAWLLTDKNINSLQVDSIQRLINRLNHAHHTDLCVRINGQDEWFEADWLKHMVRVTPPAQTQRTWVGLTDEEVKDIVWNLPYEPSQEHIRAIEAKLKERNNA
jgi:hypothetical protein